MNSARSFWELYKAAQTGDSGAMTQVGRCFEIGRGCQKDEVSARQWYQKAAKAGALDGAYNLACMCREGRTGTRLQQCILLV